MKGAFGGGPLAEIAKRNMQMIEAAANAFGNVPGMPTMPGMPGAPTPAQPASESSKDDEIANLKAQLSALNAKIDKLG